MSAVASGAFRCYDPLMLTMTNRIDIDAPIRRVWSVLLDFPSYCKWHPYFELAGNASEGSKLEFTFRRQPDAERRFTSEATIVCLKAEETFAITYGIRGFLFVEDRFELTRINGTTRVTRTTEYRGIVPLLTGWASTRRLSGLLDAPLGSLARYTSGVAKTNSVTRAQHSQGQQRRPPPSKRKRHHR